MVSAREAALRDRRYTTKRKVLRPGSLSSAADSIARKMADAEFESMVKRYGDGVVSNEEMFNYLKGAMTNPYFNDMDRVNIENKLRDFKVAVIGERLEAEYQSNTGAAKVKSAQELAAYYNDRASNLEANTPAQSKALQSVAEWRGKAEKVYSDIKKDERKLARARSDYEMSQLLPGVDTLEKQAEAYRKLAEEAQQDGETIDALEWASRSNDILTTKLPALREKEARDDIDERLDIVKSEYERGYISADEAVNELNAIDQSAQENGLFDMLTTIDTFTEKLGLDVQKGTTIEEFEGRTFRVRMPAGGELSGTIKDFKESWREEDDRFRSIIYEIEQDPEILSQYGAKSMLYNAYINGGDLGEYGQFYGLKNRKTAYESWAVQAPEKSGTYENSARDLENKINTNLDSLSEMLYALDSIAGDDPRVAQLVQDITGSFEAGRINLDGAGEMGILVTTDKFGRQVQRTIPLNTSVQTTDAAGNTVTNDTYVGSNVALVPGSGNIYVKLTPVYMSEEQRAQGFAMYYTAEYNGEIFVKTLSGNDIVPAEELAQTDKTFQEWYDSPDANTGQSMRDYAAQYNQRYLEANPPGDQPEGQVDGQIPPAGDIGQDVQLRDPNIVNLDDPSLPGIAPARGTGDQFDFGRIQNFDQTYVQPSFAKTEPRTISSPDLTSGLFNPQIHSTNIGSQLLPPPAPNALQQSGLKFNLDSSFAPPTTGTTSYQDLLSKPVKQPEPKISSFFSKAADTVKSGVSSIGNWLKSINPFN